MKKSDMRKMLAMMMENKAEVIFGVPPIVTSKKKLIYLKAFGGTEQNGTPTPDNPVDIVCNNGVLKVRHQSGLPLGYTLLDYIQSTGLVSGFYTGIQWKDVGKIEVLYQITQRGSTGNIILASLSEEPSSDISVSRVQSPYIGYLNSGTGTTFNGISGTANPNYTAIELTNNGLKSITYNIGTNTINKYIWFGSWWDSAYTPYYQFSSIKMYDTNNILVRNYIACKRNSDNTVGVYDTVSGQFFTNGGTTGTFTAGTAVSDPVEIYTAGPIETIAIKDDQDTTVSTATCEDLLSVGTYTDQQEIISGAVTRNVGIKVLDGTEEDLAFNSHYSVAYFYIQDKKIGGTDFTPLLCTHLRNNNVGYAIMGYGEIASTIRDTGINMRVSSNITSLALFKQWLADQYAAGTPVIVIYPLATPTTETVLGQTLTLTSGTNVIDITQASLQGLELEVKVK